MLEDNIISERLSLRDIVQDDAKDVWEIWSNSENEKYMSDPVESLEEVVAICKNNKNNNGYLTVATLKDTGEIIGTCCFGSTNKKR
ncbi:GNAT family N-acetyltransferase [Haloimpatiens massiliensis]|uniref:GNAT family N-acetyltransferase n=1 Tax=Haloimpatiens massiliensis TaxID=1658110 RepID=UPI000C84DB0F|nr:GNAT family N-acetyltransferase [Haloimpatiens massiliensis]